MRSLGRIDGTRGTGVRGIVRIQCPVANLGWIKSANGPARGVGRRVGVDRSPSSGVHPERVLEPQRWVVCSPGPAHEGPVVRRIEVGEAQRLRDAPKDAGGLEVEWRTVRTPSGYVVRKHLAFSVEASSGPTEGHLLVEGDWKSPEQIQILLYVVVGASQTCIARLCLTPKHGDDLHFHDERDRLVPWLSDPPKTIDENTMLDEIFIPTMKIHNLARPMLP